MSKYSILRHTPPPLLLGVFLVNDPTVYIRRLVLCPVHTGLLQLIYVEPVGLQVQQLFPNCILCKRGPTVRVPESGLDAFRVCNRNQGGNSIPLNTRDWKLPGIC